jgi:hypothetical protein
MIEEERNGCIDSIVYELTRTSEFRGRKARQYDDPRNAQAVESLKLLAKNAAERGHDYWDLLQPYYDDPDSREWRDAISQTTKEIGFTE